MDFKEPYERMKKQFEYDTYPPDKPHTFADCEARVHGYEVRRNKVWSSVGQGVLAVGVVSLILSFWFGSWPMFGTAAVLIIAGAVVWIVATMDA